MRAARMEAEFDRDRLPLVVKGSLPKTFWGIGMFVAAILSTVGTYLVSKAIREPLVADPSAVIFAGVMLAVASFLLIFLVRPRWRGPRADFEEEDPGDTPELEFASSEEMIRMRMEKELELKERRNLPGPM
jgi:hypothetical protein